MAAAEPIEEISPPSAHVAKRGGRWLDEKALRAHLATLLRLENVGVLLGAGASVDQLGGRVMSQLWGDFTTSAPASHQWLTDNDFLSEGSTNLESLLNAITIAGLEWQRIADGRLPSLRSAERDLKRTLIRGAILREEWWSQPAEILKAPPELQSHRRLLQKLCAARQPGQPAPWLFTTNYDLAIEWAAESLSLHTINGFGGVHFRVFSPHNFDLGLRNTLARGEARFGTYSIYLSKLHGSLSWYSDDDLIIERSAPSVWPSLKTFLDGEEHDVPFLVFPEVAKYIQTAAFAFGELIRRLTEFLARPQTCLMISGYSFLDDHLNRVIRAAIQNPTLQLVIYSPDFQYHGEEVLFPLANRRWLKGLDSPQVTFVGDGEAAWFRKFVEQLPDPAIYDEQALLIQRTLKEFPDEG